LTFLLFLEESFKIFQQIIQVLKNQIILTLIIICFLLDPLNLFWVLQDLLFLCLKISLMKPIILSNFNIFLTLLLKKNNFLLTFLPSLVQLYLWLKSKIIIQTKNKLNQILYLKKKSTPFNFSLLNITLKKISILKYKIHSFQQKIIPIHNKTLLILFLDTTLLLIYLYSKKIPQMILILIIKIKIKFSNHLNLNLSHLNEISIFPS
jgi:hypothetical protein